MDPSQYMQMMAHMARTGGMPRPPLGHGAVPHGAPPAGAMVQPASAAALQVAGPPVAKATAKAKAKSKDAQLQHLRMQRAAVPQQMGDSGGNTAWIKMHVRSDLTAEHTKLFFDDQAQNLIAELDTFFKGNFGAIEPPVAAGNSATVHTTLRRDPSQPEEAILLPDTIGELSRLQAWLEQFPAA